MMPHDEAETKRKIGLPTQPSSVMVSVEPPSTGAIGDGPGAAEHLLRLFTFDTSFRGGSLSTMSTGTSAALIARIAVQSEAAAHAQRAAGRVLRGSCADGAMARAARRDMRSTHALLRPRCARMVVGARARSPSRRSRSAATAAEHLLDAHRIEHRLGLAHAHRLGDASSTRGDRRVARAARSLALSRSTASDIVATVTPMCRPGRSSHRSTSSR
jgi:hypothetical protein